MTHVRRVLARAPTSQRVRRVRAFQLASREPPAEIQLWRAGDNPTDYGVHRWTERSAREVMARYAERGNPILIDVEHNGAVVGGAPAATGGYAALQLRNGEPWLSFSWSAYGAEQVATGQRRFLSPEYDIDPDTNEIVALYRVSLVADPATHNARVLASAKETASMDPTLAAILAVLNTTDDPAAANAAIKELIGQLDPGAGAGDAGGDPDAPAFAAAGDPPPAASDDPTKKPPTAANVTASAPAAPPVAAPPSSAAATPPAAPPATPPASVTAAAPSVDPEAIRVVRESAAASQNALRDMLLENHGHRLQPSIRTWASRQSLAIVQGLIAAAPEALPPPTRVTATRGAANGTGQVRAGLQGEQLDQFRMAMGTFKASSSQLPYTDERGYRVFPTTPPREVRRIMAAQAAKEGGVK